MAFLDTFKIEQGHLVRRRVQPDRERILRANEAVQLQPDVLSHLTFAGLELRIPELDLYKLRRKYPELASPDGETRTKAWRRFMASSEADPYRVTPRRRARANAPVSRKTTTENRRR